MKKWVVMMMALLLFADVGVAIGDSPTASSADSPVAVPGVSPRRAPGPIVPPRTETPDGSVDGRLDYRAKCAVCHGANAFSAMRMARRLSVNPRKLALMASEMNREEMIAITEKGKGKMPGFAKELTKERIGAVVDYILDFRAKRIQQDSMIRQKAHVTPNPAAAGKPEK